MKKLLTDYGMVLVLIALCVLFSCLTVNFGCAGGQHRSVYFVERLARHLRDAHPDLTVQVTHRERPDWPHMAAGAQLGEV